MRATFRFASKLPLDTFGFNRLCVYRGTPLWQEYVQRGLVSDADDWYKYFKCSSIDPTCCRARRSTEIRSAELQAPDRLQVPHFPLQALRLPARLVRYMPLRDVVYLFVKPFLGKTSGATNAEVLSRAVEREAIMSAAADLTQVPDATLTASAAERG